MSAADVVEYGRRVASRYAPLLEAARRHVKGYANDVDLAYHNDPICAMCGKAWPCDIARAVAEMEGR